jgi:hypothetical protein
VKVNCQQVEIDFIIYSVEWKEENELHNNVSFVATSKKSAWWKCHFDSERKMKKSYLHRSESKYDSNRRRQKRSRPKCVFLSLSLMTHLK